MDVFRTDRIRNVVLLGHGGAGKTTLAEAMAYLAGLTNRLGRVEDGNTVSDYDKEEIKRHFSITTSLIPVPWQKNKVNILDTPGYFDFVGEVEEAVSAADAAIIVVSGKAGVQVGTQKAWNLCEKYKLPRMIFVTDMDVDDVSYRKVVDQLTELYGKKIAPLHFPIREDGKFVGYVNVVKQAGRKYIDKGQKEECEIPSYLDEYLEKYHDILMESVAETSEEFMDRYFEGDEFSVTEVSAALAANVQDASIVPVCMGSPINLRGVSNLLDDICGYFPSPDKRSCNGISQKTNEIFEANYDFAKAKSAYVWKSIVDPFLGKYSLIKVCSGVIKSDDTLLNVEKGTEERLNKLYVLQGSKPIEVPELHAGDIGAIAKLVSVQTGDSLATKANPVLYPKAILSTPYTYKRFKAVNKGDEDKISQALAKIMSEDRTVRVENDGVESVSGLLSFSSFSSAFSFIISHTVPVSSFFIILSLKFSGRIVRSSHSVPKKPPDSVSKIIPPIFSRGIPEPPISIPSVSTRHSILFASVLQLPSKIPFISPSFRTNPYTLHTSPAARFPT